MQRPMRFADDTAETGVRVRIWVALVLAFAAGVIMTLLVVSPVQGGVHNCHPAWKCAPASPTPRPSPTQRATVAPTLGRTPPPTTNPTPIGTDLVGPPPIPADRGQLLRKDFADGQLAPFTRLVYLNDHPGTLETQYCDYSADATHVSVHDGYLDLRATRGAAGRWVCSLVGTFVNDGSPPSRTFDVGYGTVRAMVRVFGGQGAWDGFWQWNAWGSGAEGEIDWLELISGRTTANLHGTSADGQKVSLPAPDGGWHEYAVTRTPTYVAFLLDGVEVGRTTVALSQRLTLLADAKVGLSAPDATTPSSMFLQVAWVTVDPQ
jgi:hypothetical protein